MWWNQTAGITQPGRLLSHSLRNHVQNRNNEAKISKDKSQQSIINHFLFFFCLSFSRLFALTQMILLKRTSERAIQFHGIDSRIPRKAEPQFPIPHCSAGREIRPNTLRDFHTHKRILPQDWNNIRPEHLSVLFVTSNVLELRKDTVETHLSTCAVAGCDPLQPYIIPPRHRWD